MLYMTQDSQPALRCAVCELPIFGAADAVVVYPRGLAAGNMQRVSVTHPAFCQTRAQEEMENGLGPGLAMSLTEYGDRLRAAAAPSAAEPGATPNGLEGTR